MIEHLARPGPGYWEWRCLRCSEPCSQHTGLIRFLLRKVLRRGGEREQR